PEGQGNHEPQGQKEGCPEVGLMERYLPMLAVSAEPFDSAEYLFEVKWNGVRALAARADGLGPRPGGVPGALSGTGRPEPPPQRHGGRRRGRAPAPAASGAR